MGFDAVPETFRRTIFCQPFLCFASSRGDLLWVTRLGWPFIDILLPDTWHDDGRYLRQGQRLSDSTSTVYRVPTRRCDLVVKYNRVGQEVLLHYDQQAMAGITRQDVDNAAFLGPFEEVATVLEMRAGYFGPPDLHILAKWPLAIFSPAARPPAWSLGRSESAFQCHAAVQARDQSFYPAERRVVLEEDRDYITLHRWIRGIDVAALVAQGRLTAERGAAITARAAGDLAAKGFRVIDFKAAHVIVRPRRDGSLLCDRDGRERYALVDFELLERLPAYCDFIAAGGAAARHTPGRRI